MKHISALTTKGISRRKSRPWRLTLSASLFLFLLLAAFSSGLSASASTAPNVSARHGFSISPTSGPVGTVITVTGSNLVYPDGTQVSLGYTTDFSNCRIVAQAQAGPTSNHAFSGWLSWPATTGTGTFGVCVMVTGFNSFLVDNFRVLSASAPQITVTPETPSAGTQATVTGANFLPGKMLVNFFWKSVSTGATVALGSATSDDTGAFTSTLMIPANSSTGSYTLLANVGTANPPTLSASTTFHVNGITIVPVSTPGAKTTPTAQPTALPATSTAVTSTTPLDTGDGDPGPAASSTRTSDLLLPILLVGALLIIVALVTGVLLVHRQRNLAVAISNTNSPIPPLPATMGNGRAPAPMMNTFAPNNQTYIASPPPAPPVLNTPPAPAPAPVAQESIAFDPDLAEAMHQAQVSLFAMPRPPAGEEVHS